jgi:hypothetical protein
VLAQVKGSKQEQQQEQGGPVREAEAGLCSPVSAGGLNADWLTEAMGPSSVGKDAAHCSTGLVKQEQINSGAFILETHQQEEQQGQVAAAPPVAAVAGSSHGIKLGSGVKKGSAGLGRSGPGLVRGSHTGESQGSGPVAAEVDGVLGGTVGHEGAGGLEGDVNAERVERVSSGVLSASGKMARGDDMEELELEPLVEDIW